MFEIGGISDHKMIRPKNDRMMITKAFKCVSRKDSNQVLRFEPTTNGENVNWWNARHELDMFDFDILH